MSALEFKPGRRVGSPRLRLGVPADQLVDANELIDLSPEAYRRFLEAKVPQAKALGFEVDPAEVNPALKDFVRAIVPAACRAGRFGIFSRFGLHKTSTQLEIARLGLKRGAVPLITLPLGVRQEFMADAARWFAGERAIDVRFIRRTEEADARSINLTNTESVREGKVDPTAFDLWSWDEADVFRGFGGTKTFREAMAASASVRWRFVATATPDPNEYIELLAYAAWLGIMEVSEAKTRFFKRDSQKADKLTLHPHKEAEFWLWVASWSIFLQKPSDLGFSDEGYAMPALDVRWHEVPSDHGAAGEERSGQQRMFRDAAKGLVEAAREKRDSLPARLARLQEIRAEDPEAHRIVWHDLEDERRAIEAACPGLRSIYGSQDLETNEATAQAFKAGMLRELGAKPQMSGAGGNFQPFCHWEVFLGIGHKFRDFIQAVHRLQRLGQKHPVRVDLIHSEAEREIRRGLEAKWARYERQAEKMAEIIRRYGLSHAALAGALARSIGVERLEAQGSPIGSGTGAGAPGWRLVNNDSVEELRGLPPDSVQLVVTSIPFSTQYEYTPSYNDFGHTDDNEHFWRQMGFLTPQLLRVVEPGRDVVVHVKDRVVPGGINGLGFQTVRRFSDEAADHFERHGFAFLGRITITTDVVRENNQTYRLGWTEQCRDGSRMGAGLPEYLLVFRKPPSDRSDGFADRPVVKEKPWCDDPGNGAGGAPAPFDKRRNWRRPLPGTGYSRAMWQLDANGDWRSSGDRLLEHAERLELAGLLSQAELMNLPHEHLYKRWRAWSLANVYDHELHVAATEALDRAERLPSTFALMPPHHPHPDVWDDVARMRSLNTMQAQRRREQHLCPLPFDIVTRCILQRSQPGELVLDPFSGLGTVALRAFELGRRGLGIELNAGYHAEAVGYLEAAEKRRAVPTLFELMGLKAEVDAAAERLEPGARPEPEQEDVA